MRKILYLILGAMTFIITQLLLRLPLLNLLNQSFAFNRFQMRVGVLLTGTLIAFSAGLFEETGRVVLFRLLPEKNDGLAPGIYCGLGHGIFEALWIYFKFMAGYPLSFIQAGLLERAMTILIHLGLSIFVFQGVRKGKVLRTWLLAILLHGLVDCPIPYFQLKGRPDILMMLVIIAGVFALVYTIYMIKKEQKKGAINHE